MNTGSVLMGKPSLGSWVTYGLGSENRNLPGFVVMLDQGAGIKGGPPAWGSGFLPASFQGTTVRAGETPILHLNRPHSVSPEQQRRLLDFINQRNQEHLVARRFDDQLSARIEAYELAFRMQQSAPDVLNVRSRDCGHSPVVWPGSAGNVRIWDALSAGATHGRGSGVRFVQLYSGDTNGWDAHKDVLRNHTRYCRATDKPVAGLLTDLKQRGLLDEDAHHLGRRVRSHADERTGNRP